MRDWTAYADHLRALAEQDPSGVFVGADVVLELIDERVEMLRAMIRIGAGDELCDHCANSPERNRCEKNDLTCPDCPCDCVCKDCDGVSGFVWAGKHEEPSVVVSDEPEADPDAARYVIAMLADGNVMPLQVGERPGLEQLQTMVGGNIEILEFRVPGRGVRYIAVFDEEGKLKDLPVNDRATREFMQERSCIAGDYLAGTVLVLKAEGEYSVGLTREETEMLLRCFGVTAEG